MNVDGLCMNDVLQRQNCSNVGLLAFVHNFGCNFEGCFLEVTFVWNDITMTTQVLIKLRTVFNKNVI